MPLFKHYNYDQDSIVVINVQIHFSQELQG
jgi:hypothetical protein